MSYTTTTTTTTAAAAAAAANTTRDLCSAMSRINHKSERYLLLRFRTDTPVVVTAALQ